MKLVYQADREDEARGIKLMLEANGIPAALTGEFMFSVMSVGIPKVVGVWVYLDSQADEAERLIQDPEYEVTQPVDVEDFYRFSDSSEVKERVLSQMLKVTVMAVAGLLLFIWFLAAML
ncbi:MAG: DUF2007 domain-containing protein [Chromatiales bacterium]|nr:DUF2007 domain-containing protein [Chromatiales bacterium]